MRTSQWSRLGRASILAALLLCVPVFLQGAPLDIDGDGSVASATDGQLILRHLFGFSGPSLVNGAVAPGALRDADAIGDYLAGMDGSLDVDGDGRADALTDGILILRHLLGRTGGNLTVGALSPGATRDAAAIAAGIDGIPAPAGQTPARVTLVQANSLATNSIQLDWLPTFDNDTPGSRIRYVLHASEQEGFVPDSTTARTEVIDNATGTITGLTAATAYYVKVQALDTWGNASWSNELRAVTAAADPQPTAAPRQVLDASNAPDQNPLPDRIDYRLGAGSAPPAAGDYLVSAEGEGFLRRATGVQRTGDQVSVTTEPAALNELFTNLDLSTEIKLIDLPESAGPQARSVGRGVLYQRASNTVRAIWPESGLTIIETRQPAANLRAAPPTPRAAAGSTPCDGRTGQRRTVQDGPLTVTYPELVCVEPGTQLSVDITAEISPEDRGRYQLTYFELERVSHPKKGAPANKFGARWTPTRIGDDAEEKGVLRWTPSKSDLDDDLRPFTARVVAVATERVEICKGFGIFTCDVKRIRVETDIIVSWGDFPENEAYLIHRSATALDFNSLTKIDFQPDLLVRTEHNDIGRLIYGLAELSGSVSFTNEINIRASRKDELEMSTANLVDRRFVKILVVGRVPIVINGRLRLRAEFRASTDAQIDLTQTIQANLDIRAGLEYRHGSGWRVIKEATPWYRYALKGEAEAHAYVELRFVPDLEIAFYDVVTGRLIVEPYVFAETEVEGHFHWEAGSDIENGGDADYRFTQLDIGGGMDARLRAGLEIFDYSIVGFPSRDRDQLLVLDGNLAPIKKTVFLGLPELKPVVTACGIEDCAALGLGATVENLRNPFYPTFSNQETLNAFIPESAQWKVVYKDGHALDGTEQMEPDEDEPTKAWFKADVPATYTLRFSGNSALGSFVRQYEDLEVDYDRSQCCDRWAVITVPVAHGLRVFEVASDYTVTERRNPLNQDGVAIVTPEPPSFFDPPNRPDLRIVENGLIGSNLSASPEGRLFSALVGCRSYTIWDQCGELDLYLYELDIDAYYVAPPRVVSVLPCTGYVHGCDTRNPYGSALRPASSVNLKRRTTFSVGPQGEFRVGFSNISLIGDLQADQAKWLGYFFPPRDCSVFGFASPAYFDYFRKSVLGFGGMDDTYHWIFTLDGLYTYLGYLQLPRAAEVDSNNAVLPCAEQFRERVSWGSSPAGMAVSGAGRFFLVEHNGDLCQLLELDRIAKTALPVGRPFECGYSAGSVGFEIFGR